MDVHTLQEPLSVRYIHLPKHINPLLTHFQWTWRINSFAAALSLWGNVSQSAL